MARRRITGSITRLFVANREEITGLGGCPYAKGASGNVATEDVVYLLDGLGIQHGVDLERCVKVGRDICNKLNKQPSSLVNQAHL